MSERRCDVLIVGGGPVGSALACALARLPVSTVLVEAQDPGALEQPGFDARVLALANGSRRILDGLGLWPQLSNRAEPIRTIHVSEQGRFGAARIDAREEGVDALGYTLESRALGRALWDALSDAAGFKCLAPATLVALQAGADAVRAEIRHAGRAVDIRAKLLVAADGARSRVRDALGIAARRHDYGQSAVILNCATEAHHAGRAFERFTRTGPLALLPAAGGHMAAIWTLPADRADGVAELPAEAFREGLQSAFGYRLGRFTRVGERRVYTLSRVTSSVLHGRRAVLIGNAAVSLHPVAGQGFNLALRDAATLAEVIADQIADAAPGGDAGADRVLERYREWRAGDQRRVARFTHGLIGLFGLAAPGLGIARGLGLAAFDLAPGAKAALARQTMGKSGRLPRLARGVELDGAS